MNNDWLSEKITYISALKNPSDAQKLLLELAQIQYRTPDQEKKLNAFIKAEKAIDRANKQKLAVRKLLNAEKEAERKARTRHLIQLGVVSGNGKYSTLRFFNCAQWPKFSTTYLGFASP